MPAKSPEERSLIARIAADESWAQTEDRSARTAKAREANLRRFEREVDPDNLLDPAERARRAEHKKRAFYNRLALAGVRARQGKAAS